MSQYSSLRGHFLIAMPHMQDPLFASSLSYICEHDEEGAMGVIINRPLDFDLPSLFSHLDIDADNPAQGPVYGGGPVARERGFILHRQRMDQHWASTVSIGEGLCLTSSLDILEAMAHGEGPERDEVIVALGYAGWGPGQLDAEILRNDWLSCPADLDIMFATPAEQRLQAAATSLGVDLSLLTAHSGTA
ncbi:MAG: YqgE/AlgH family protein [Marinobacterium sp.]|nr:YqgE/AlgH family protein [Marinobacterium sp.]